MCAYFLGKGNTGDLASVLSGAYGMSSDPVNLAGAEPSPKVPPTTQPPQEQPPTGGFNGAKCVQFCKGQGYVYDSPEFNRCFDNCIAGGGSGGNGCDANHPCPTGKCVNGKCVDEPGDGGGGGTCPSPRGADYEGCSCGVGYSSLDGKCITGYTFIKRDNPADWKSGIPYIEGAIGTCQCQKAISDWENKKKGQLGEYKYPAEMQGLMDLLLARGKEFMGLTPGFSQTAQNNMFGQGFENVRAGEAGQRNTMEQGLSRQGMLGTGAGQGMLNDLSWNTEGNVANLARDLFVQNELKKKQDLIDYSTAAQGILGGGMDFQRLLESINSARRGEGASAFQNLLAWLLSQK